MNYAEWRMRGAHEFCYASIVISTSSEVLAFAELLIAAHDPASLYRAFEIGLGAIYTHHSFVSSFAFDRKHGGPMSTWSCPARPEHTPDWWARNAAMHPGYKYAAEHPGIPVCRCSDALPDDELEDHPYYRTFVEPEGYRYAMAILVWDGPHVVGYVAINRSREQGDFDEDDRALALKLHPLIVAAYMRIASTHVLGDVRVAQGRLLATLPIAALIYSRRDRRVLFHNRASKDAVANWRGERARNRPRAVTASWLPSEIVDACTEVSRAGATVQCADRPMRAVLRQMDARSHFSSDVVLIVFEDDEREVGAGKPSAAWLRLARRLSSAEQEAARLAARGLTNIEIGKHLAKSALTVKKQLESVFSKAGVANRAELTAYVAGFRGPRTARAS